MFSTFKEEFDLFQEHVTCFFELFVNNGDFVGVGVGVFFRKGGELSTKDRFKMANWGSFPGAPVLDLRGEEVSTDIIQKWMGTSFRIRCLAHAHDCQSIIDDDMKL